MGVRAFTFTGRDRMLAHWLALMPEYLHDCARFGCWDAHCDALDLRLGDYGMGRN